MNERSSRTAWTGIVVSIAIAVVGWGFFLTDKLSATSHDSLKQEIHNEAQARSDADKALSDTLDKVAENTKDVPGLVAEMRIVLNKLGLDGKR